MSMRNKLPILAIVAIVVLILSGILQFIALATPYWYLIYRGTLGQVGHGGLWHGCHRMTLIIYCSSPTVLPGWLTAVRILEVFGMMFMSGALMMMVIFLVLSSLRWANMAKNSAAASAIVAGLLIMIAAVIYGISLKNNTEVLFMPRTDPLYFLTTYHYQLYWGFGLSVAAAILCVVSGIIIGFAKKPQQVQSSNQTI